MRPLSAVPIRIFFPSKVQAPDSFHSKIYHVFKAGKSVLYILLSSLRCIRRPSFRIWYPVVVSLHRQQERAWLLNSNFLFWWVSSRQPGVRLTNTRRSLKIMPNILRSVQSESETGNTLWWNLNYNTSPAIKVLNIFFWPWKSYATERKVRRSTLIQFYCGNNCTGYKGISTYCELFESLVFNIKCSLGIAV